MSTNTGQIIKSKSSKRYTVLQNCVIKDPRLSMAAKGLFAYLQSLPEDWVIYKKELVNHFKNGRDAVANAFIELQEIRLIETVEVRDEKGRIGYNHVVFDTFQDSPHTGLPLTVEPHTVGPLTVNPSLLNTNTTKERPNKVNTNIASQVLQIIRDVKTRTSNKACPPLKLTAKRERMIRNRLKDFNAHWPGRDFLKACAYAFEYKAKEWHGTNMWKYFDADTLLTEKFVGYLEKAEENKGVPPSPNTDVPPTVAPKSPFQNFDTRFPLPNGSEIKNS